jgi:hypothetical protein
VSEAIARDTGVRIQGGGPAPGRLIDPAEVARAVNIMSPTMRA